MLLQPRGRRFGLGRIAAGQDHARPAPGQLPAGLDPYAAIAPVTTAILPSALCSMHAIVSLVLSLPAPRPL